MPARDVITVGASAGGVEALVTLVRALPRDLPAAVFVVLHVGAGRTSVLPTILTRAGTLPARHPEDGEAIAPGTIYVAPPDLHMLVSRGHVHLRRGPKENSARPAVDPLMRSAADAYGRRVVGVVLTGNLDDGTAGLAAIRARGGVTVVQDPAEALFPGMPRSAVENAAPDHVLTIRDIAPLLGRLATTALREDDRMSTESGGNGDGRDHVHDEYTEVAGGDAPSVYTCPECHGTLWEVHDNGLFAFRCRVGHRYSTETLVAEQEVALEAALWTALRALEESAALSRRLAKRAEERGQVHAVTRFSEQASDRERRADVVRAALESGSVAAARGGEPSSATAAL